MGGDNAALARSGNMPNYVPVPALGDDAFAFLDITTTVEKTVLSTASRRQGLQTERERRAFALSVGRHYSRYPLPDELRHVLRRFLDRIRARHGKGSAEARVLAATESIRIRGLPSWAASEIHVYLTIVRPIEAEDPFTDADWDKYVEQWKKLCDVPHGRIKSIDMMAIALDVMSAAVYKHSDVLDFDYLSPPMDAPGEGGSDG